MNSSHITKQDLETYKKLYPNDQRLQALTLEELIANTQGVEVDFNSLSFFNGVELLTGTALDCGLSIGYVVFDCVCLLLGAAALRSSATAEAVEAIGEEVKPAASAIQETIAQIAKEDATAYEQAKGVFSIISTIYSAGCMGGVLSSFLGSLTWYTAALYGVTGMATIVAAVATDGAAEIGLIAVELATAGFLTVDSINAVEACK